MTPHGSLSQTTAPASPGTTIICRGCGRRAASNSLDEPMLRALTGYQPFAGDIWCPECSSALKAAGAG